MGVQRDADIDARQCNELQSAHREVVYSTGGGASNLLSDAHCLNMLWSEQKGNSRHLSWALLCAPGPDYDSVLVDNNVPNTKYVDVCRIQ